MKKSIMEKFQSITKLEYNIARTAMILTCLNGSITLISHLDLKEQLKLITLDPDIKEYLKAFKIPDKNDQAYLYEIGYIGLFADFEIFMMDFLKELFVKFPNSFPKDTKLDIDELSMLTSVKQIKEFMIDKAAVTKSYDLTAWVNFLKDKYKITIFKTKLAEERFYFLNELRNSLMHSGGKISSKFKNFLQKTFKIKKGPRLNQKFTSDYKKFFDLLMDELKTLLGNLKKTKL